MLGLYPLAGAPLAGNLATGDVTPPAVAVATPVGGGIGHGGFSRLIIVEVDGETFRVPESQLQAFLAALRETVEEAPLRITKKRKKEAPKPVDIKIVHVPKEIKPYVAREIDRTREIINNIVRNAFMEYMQELDDEETLFLLL